MLDVVLKWSADGQQQVIQSAKAITSEVNKGFGAAQQQRQAQWSRQQQQLAREARREAFAKLTTEEKLARLTERRIHLERMLQRAQAQGNQYRITALRTSLAQVNSATGILPGGGGGFGAQFRSGFGAGMSPALGIFGAAALGGGIGSTVGLALGAAAIMLVGAIRRSAMSAVALADNLDNLAEQIQVSRGDVLRMQEAAAMTGVPQRAALRGISQLANVRAMALAGDADARALLENYGVGSEMLSSDSTTLAIAQRIRSSLGAAGMRTSDESNMRRLFGEMPGRQIALLGAMERTEDASGIEASMAKLDRANSRWEAFQFRMARLSMRFWADLPTIMDSLAAGTLGRRNVGALRPAAAPAITPASGPRTAGDYQVTAGDQARSSLGGLGTLGGARTAADALARIGLFIGVNNPALRRMDQQIAELRRITRELQGMHRTIQEEA